MNNDWLDISYSYYFSVCFLLKWMIWLCCEICLLSFVSECILFRLCWYQPPGGEDSILRLIAHSHCLIIYVTVCCPQGSPVCLFICCFYFVVCFTLIVLIVRSISCDKPVTTKKLMSPNSPTSQSPKDCSIILSTYNLIPPPQRVWLGDSWQLRWFTTFVTQIGYQYMGD